MSFRAEHCMLVTGDTYHVLLSAPIKRFSLLSAEFNDTDLQIFMYCSVIRNYPINVISWDYRITALASPQLDKHRNISTDVDICKNWDSGYCLGVSYSRSGPGVSYSQGLRKQKVAGHTTCPTSVIHIP